MNIYLLKQNVNIDYYTYDAVVVAAESEEVAITITPDGIPIGQDKYTEWAYTLNDVQVTLIGTAKDGVERGVILASYNEG